jgi:hypothetical protein
LESRRRARRAAEEVAVSHETAVVTDIVVVENLRVVGSIPTRLTIFSSALSDGAK